MHVVTEPPLYLGHRVDAERDGQVSANVDGDNNDSNGFSVNTAGTLHMTASASQTPTVLQLPQPLTLIVGDGVTLKDGAIFNVTNNSRTVAFEYDSDNPASLGSVGATRIAFAATDTLDQIGAATVSALAANPDLGLLPSYVGEGAVHLGSDGVSVLPGRGLSESGIANPITDGETFFIEVPSSGGLVRYTFEFENRQLNNGVVKGHIPVLFDKSTSQDGYVQAVRTALLGARLGIAATDLGSGQLELSGDDEDGVVMSAFNRNTVTEVIVTASADGLLDAWIDFNIDGDFDDPGEQILASQQVKAGQNTFEVTPPADTVDGRTVGRFRLSSIGGLRPTGLAPDGEVEDYVVNILAGTPPVARNDSYTTNEDETGTTVLGSVLDNDINSTPGTTLSVPTYQLISALGSSIAMSPDGNFRYNARRAPALQALDVGQSLTDTFTYRASDGTFLSSAATVTITVQGRNDAPTAVADTQFTDQNKAIDINVVGNDLDPEKHPLTVTNVVPGVGTVTINTALNLVRYDPAGRFKNLNTGQSTTDSFTYQVSDGHGGVSTGTVVVTIFGLNDPPQAVTDLWTALNPIARTTEASTVAISVLANDIDPEGTKLTVTAVQLVGTKGLVTVNNLGSFDNTVTYNPNGKFESLGVGKTATDTFLYTVKDEDGYSAVGTVTVTIDGLNDAPTAVADANASVARNGTVAINVLSNDKDIDGDTLQVETVSLAGTKGLAFRNADNTITYNPNHAFDSLKMGQQATDRFTYTISDGHGGTSTAAVTVTVFGASDPPVAVNDSITTTEDESVVIDVLFNDTDDFGPKTVVAVDETGLLGSVVINPPNTANNQVVYSPNGQFDTLQANETATEKFTYTVSDGIGQSVGTVTVTIKGVNDAPIANIDPNGYTVVRGGVLHANDLSGTVNGPADDGVLLNDTDAEGDALRAQLLTGPQYATAGGFTLNANGSFTYRHNGGISTYDTFTYQAVDAFGAVSQQIVTVVLSIVESPGSDWQNPILRWDVNNDGYVSPINVLLVINYVNAHPDFPPLPVPRPAGDPFYDVNGDGIAGPADVVAVINRINDLNAQSGGEGEGEVLAAPLAAGVWADELIAAQDAPAASAAGGTNLTAPALTSPPRDERRRDEPRTIAAVQPARAEPRLRTAAQPDTIRLDRFGLEDVLDSIAADVGDSFAEASPWDDILAHDAY